MQYYVSLHSSNAHTITLYVYLLWHQYHEALACVPQSATVQLENGDRNTMKDLLIGDSVMVMDENQEMAFSDVHLMIHKLDEAYVNYVIIETETGQRLTLGMEHIVYVSSLWNSQPGTRMAKKVKF